MITDNAETNHSTKELFDLENLRQDHTITVGDITERVRTAIPVRKPGKQDFFRVLKEPKYQLTVACFTEDEEKELFIIAKNIIQEARAEFGSEIKTYTLFTAILKNGSVFLIPARHPNSEMKRDEWATSMFRCLKIAEDKWIKMKANTSIGAYEAFPAIVQAPDPEPIKEIFEELLKIAFDKRVINTMDHPVFKKVRGDFE